MSTTHRRSPARRVLSTFFYSLCDARLVTALHRILVSSFEVIQIYPTCSLKVVRVGGVFWRIFSGKIFLNKRVIMRAFSKFCRLEGPIGFRSAAPSTNKPPLTTARGGEGREGVVGWATASEVAGEALTLPHARATVSSSSATVCLCLLLVCSNDGGQVFHHVSAQSHHGGDGEGATAASGSVNGAGALQSAVSLGDLSFGLASVGAKHWSVCRLWLSVVL